MSSVFSSVQDVRSQLYRNTATGGPNRRVPLASKRGLIVHWNGPTVGDDDMATLVADSRYHAFQVDWSSEAGVQHGDGLMYHLAVGQDGTLYWCRDIESVLWHCAAWPENEVALSVLVLCAANRAPTLQQYGGLRTIVDRWRVAGYTDRASVKGHQEVSSTSCPGPDLMKWVKAYRGEGAMTLAEQADAAMEATYQAHQQALGGKRYAAILDRPYWKGRVLVCDGGVIKGDGGLLATGLGAVDDLETYWKDHNVLTRL